MNEHVMDRSAAASTPNLAKAMRSVVQIARSKTPEEVVDNVRSVARDLIGCEGIAIILKDGDLCHYVEEDAVGPLWKGQKFPAVACISGWAMINGETAIVPDIAKDPRIPYELYAGTFVRALAMVPVDATDPKGAIGAYWADLHHASSAEIEILEALADSASAAFDRLNAHVASATRFATQDPVQGFEQDIRDIESLAAVPAILDIACRITGMGFSAVARVTEDRWITCKSLDHVAFGLKPGDELAVESTICNEIRNHREPVVIDDVDADPLYRDHHTPKIYGLKSYISVPIIREDGSFFGTLCAIDQKPNRVNTPDIVGTFRLFAELIAFHLDAEKRIREANDELAKSVEHGKLRDQFIAVLGHDLRNPLAALDAGASMLLKRGWTDKSPLILRNMKASIRRSQELVDNVMDFARSELGSGIALKIELSDQLPMALSNVIEEMRVAHPDRRINAAFSLTRHVSVDHSRMGQMLGNLLGNAVAHGSVKLPIRVELRDAGEALELSVSNGGIPIPASMVDRLFQPFFRGGASQGEGLGLGLYIAANIAKAHGGEIAVRSDRSETVFTFRMPIALA